DLPSVLRDPLVALITPACYTDLFLNFNLSNVDCIKLLISKGLGMGLVAGGALLKLPQIAKIVNARSGEGLSVNSLIIETLGFGLMLAYNLRLNNAFSTYGEGFFIFGQNLIILMLIYKYSGNLLTGLALVLACVASFFALHFESITSLSVLAMFQAGSIPLLLAGKIPQIIQNHQDKSTGQLSAFTVFAMFLGAAARVFTTLQEVDDLILIVGVVLSATLNGVVAMQMLAYWNTDASKAQTKKK
ncbi:polyketide synthase, partial [Syncephalis plumigaleata]